MTTKFSGNANISLELQSDLIWYAKPIGEIFYLRDDLAGCPIPPTDKPGFRYIKLTASDTYNNGVLTSESVSGSAPLVIATAVISLVGSLLNGRTINLLNTERRFLRAGAAGSLEDDAYQTHIHSIIVNAAQGSAAIPAAGLNLGASNVTQTSAPVDGSRNTTETRPKNQGITAYMRIL